MACGFTFSKCVSCVSCAVIVSFLSNSIYIITTILQHYFDIRSNLLLAQLMSFGKTSSLFDCCILIYYIILDFNF